MSRLCCKRKAFYDRCRLGSLKTTDRDWSAWHCHIEGRWHSWPRRHLWERQNSSALLIARRWRRCGTFQHSKLQRTLNHQHKSDNNKQPDDTRVFTFLLLHDCTFFIFYHFHSSLPFSILCSSHNIFIAR